MRAATDAQARRLASLWADPRCNPLHVPRDPRRGYVTSTDRIVVDRGWVVPVGAYVTFPNGTEADLYQVSASGIAALAAFFAGESR